jgi:hypothetical protein
MIDERSVNQKPGRTGVRSIVRLLALVLASALAIVLVLELAFRLGGLWVAAAPVPAPDGSTVVLCVGDSHTYGRPDPDNYPAQLERILNERARGRYRVINVGVPGMNTAQVRARFERNLAYYRPAIVLHWAGINNFWNIAERGQDESLAARLADESRLVRFVRVALFYRRLSEEQFGDPVTTHHGKVGKDGHFHVKQGADEEDVLSAPTDSLPADEVGRVTREDLSAMMQIAWERRIPMYLVAYSFFAGGYYVPVNEAVRTVSETFNVPYVKAGAAVPAAKAEAPNEKLFDAWVHPTPILYKHIAGEVYRILVSQGVVTPR